MFPLQAQNPTRGSFRLMTFNVENLFDTQHDEGKHDEDFLPESAREWTEERYVRKLHQICEVISDVGGEAWPFFVSLVEVENERVLQDLLGRTALREVGYRYVMTHSADARGMDVALLYLEDRFRVEQAEEWRVDFSSQPGKRSRNVLYVRGRLHSGPPLHFMVVHMPSRREGKRLSDPVRHDVVRMLQSRSDSILAHEPQAAIIAMGDFNSTPQDRITLPWAHPLTARTSPVRSDLMYDVTHLKAPGGMPGSYNYRGRWQQLDRIVVSGGMLIKDAPVKYRPLSASSMAFRQWTVLGADGSLRPRRTYGGISYIGGVSDHLPVKADFYYLNLPIGEQP